METQTLEQWADDWAHKNGLRTQHELIHQLLTPRHRR